MGKESRGAMLCMVSTSPGLSACPDYARGQGWLKASPSTPVTPVGRVRWGGLRGFSSEVAHHASYARGYSTRQQGSGSFCSQGFHSHSDMAWTNTAMYQEIAPPRREFSDAHHRVAWDRSTPRSFRCAQAVVFVCKQLCCCVIPKIALSSLSLSVV